MNTSAHRFTLSDFDFALPPELIAQHPAAERTASRLLDARSPALADRVFRDLPGLLHAGDLLVFNDTKVVKARLFGEKSTGGKVELLIERVMGAINNVASEVVAHIKVSKKPPVGGTLHMVGGSARGGFEATLLGRWPDEQGALFRFALTQHGAPADAYALMDAHGHVPLPPYIEHADEAQDVERYQTVFAKHPGAVAAPTAALHFDETLLQQLDAMGVQRAHVTLHVGADTFQPVKTENIAEHTMHFERYSVPPETQQKVRQAKAEGRRVIAVGTTSVRALESWATRGEASGDTNIFITPGYEFKLVDLLVTNFHLPKSTLMMLVSAFAGYAHMRRVYEHAIANRYRFFSYGDSMLLARCPG
jgi:S-adenosylmethionine:tRNA ribosyltransferase-isomerase